jgi:hypothetical protein
MIRVPVLLGFNHAQQIGTLEVDEKQLPPGAGYHFALGYRVLEHNGAFAEKIELLCVGLTPDDQFRPETLPRPFDGSAA